MIAVREFPGAVEPNLIFESTCYTPPVTPLGFNSEGWSVKVPELGETVRRFGNTSGK